MPSQPATVNSAASALNQIIKQANSAGCRVVIALATADQPWLGLPGVKQGFSWVLGWLDGYLCKAEQQGATFLVIDAQVAAEQSAVTKAWAELVAAQKSGDANAIKSATQKYADAHSAFVHSDGSAAPV